MKTRYYAYVRRSRDTGKDEVVFISDKGRYYKPVETDKRKYIFSTLKIDIKRMQCYIERGD